MVMPPFQLAAFVILADFGITMILLGLKCSFVSIGLEIEKLGLALCPSVCIGFLHMEVLNSSEEFFGLYYYLKRLEENQSTYDCSSDTEISRNIRRTNPGCIRGKRPLFPLANQLASHPQPPHL